MMDFRNSVNVLFLRRGIALLHHDVSEKDLNLGLFQEAARVDHSVTEILTSQC